MKMYLTIRVFSYCGMESFTNVLRVTLVDMIVQVFSILTYFSISLFHE